MTNHQRDNKENYESVREYLTTSLEHVISAGHSVKEFSEFTLDKFGDTFTPYLRQFLNDVQQGFVTIKGLSDTAGKNILGLHVTPEQREEMIREAAYYRAEKHGFTTGREHDDWEAAEQEIDALLAKQAGLVARGRKAVESSLSIIEKEIDEVKNVVSDWLDNNVVVAEKPVKVAAPKKAVTKKKAAAKKAVKKKAAPKKATAKKATGTTTAAKEEESKSVAATASGGEEKPARAPAKKAVKKKAVSKKKAAK